PVVVFQQLANVIEEEPLVVLLQRRDGVARVDDEHAHLRDILAVGDLRRIEADLVPAAAGEQQQCCERCQRRCRQRPDRARHERFSSRAMRAYAAPSGTMIHASMIAVRTGPIALPNQSWATRPEGPSSSSESCSMSIEAIR